MTRVAYAGVVIASLVGVGATSPVIAADLPAPVGIVDIEETVVPAARIDWSGFYVGGHLGWGWANFGTSGGDIDADGIIGGAHAGYNYMLSPSFLLGAEAEFDFTDYEDTETIGGQSVTAETSWISTVRGRAGVTFDQFLLYGVGGLAIADVELSGPNGSDSDIRFGWTAGAGAEALVTQNISTRLEYSYVDFGDESYNLGTQTVNSDLSAHQIKAGISYKF
ncbi:MAG: outer membrane protein [Stappiaceae bacterium]